MSHQALKMEADNSSVPTLEERAEAVKSYIGEDEPTQETQEVQEERPDWLDPKFKSAEEMAKAYGELESKLGQPTEETTEEDTEEVAQEVDTEEVPQGDTPAQQVAIGKATEGFFETGEITSESYEELAQAGISKEIVDEYVSNYQAAQELNQLKTNMAANQVKESVGGEESYQQMTSWAKKNLTTEEQKSYNDAVESGDMGLINLAVSGLYSKYSSSNSIPPSNQLKGMSAPSTTQGFSNTKEMSQAMQNPKYGVDAAYTKSVRDRVAASSW
jgi:hypothetical protein